MAIHPVAINPVKTKCDNTEFTLENQKPKTKTQNPKPKTQTTTT